MKQEDTSEIRDINRYYVQESINIQDNSRVLCLKKKKKNEHENPL